LQSPSPVAQHGLRAIQDFDLVVADLTFHNPNVFYDVAVRHAIEKPIIHLIEPRLSKIPFDVSGFRTIEFDLTDPDSIENAVEQLRHQSDQAQAGVRRQVFFPVGRYDCRPSSRQMGRDGPGDLPTVRTDDLPAVKTEKKNKK
jgi:hypothetical protein